MSRTVHPVALVLLGLALATLALTEVGRAYRTQVDTAPALARIVPLRFAGWRATDGGPAAVSPYSPDLIGTSGVQYNDVVTRTYRDEGGRSVMLVLAYKQHMEQENKVHRPEICYVAQGYRLADQRRDDVAIAGRTIPVAYFLGRGVRRDEQVAYWIRSGGEVVSNGWGLRLSILRAALHGVIPDGLLVRASMIVPTGGEADDPRTRATLTAFLSALVDALPKDDRRLLEGGAGAAGRAAGA